MGWDAERDALLKEAAENIRSAASALARQKAASDSVVEAETVRLTKLASIYTQLKYVDLANAVLTAEKQAREALPTELEDPYAHSYRHQMMPELVGMGVGGVSGAIAGGLAGGSRAFQRAPHAAPLLTAYGALAGAALGITGGAIKGRMDAVKEHDAVAQAYEKKNGPLPTAVRHPYANAALQGIPMASIALADAKESMK